MRSESTIRGLKDEIQVLKEAKIQDALLHSRQLSLSAWRSAESVIKNTHNLQYVAIFDKNPHGEYELFFKYDGYRFACVVLNQNHNVSIFCRPDGLPCGEGRFTMVLTCPGHPESDVCCPIVVPQRDRNDGRGSLAPGNAHWLTEAAFEQHFYHDRMALGVRFPARDYDSQSQGSGEDESEGEWEDPALIEYEEEGSGEDESADGSADGSEAGSDESSEVDAGSLQGDVEAHQFPDYEESEVDDDAEEEGEDGRSGGEQSEEGSGGESEEEEEEEDESEWEDGR